jgi:hypothetical protein
VIVAPAPAVEGAVNVVTRRSGPMRSVRNEVLLVSATSLTTPAASALAKT